jgi:LPXTG-motif cell wall-anchored protein
MTHSCIDVQPGQVQVGSPALCVENDIYTENNCIKKCIDGTKKDLKCCGQGETVTWNENNKNDAFGGYYCYSSQTQSNNSSQSNSNTLIIAGAIIVGFIILAIILSRRKKK